ncbi:uncharacterized protein LOC121424548 [Lytechinus variegatus]|uniref:uncharacterized protein LOC121424548 n=1 Tax=Lytechinus variegatus TaxID=7654 RepID=UPI001BB22285|nr:uncharacterized protein LOC121424548 [Lytechinus variegatus]
MEHHFGYSVIRNFDYSQPFAEGIVNKGQRGHRNLHIVSKTYLDIFLPIQSHDPARTTHKVPISHQDEKHGVDSRQKLIIGNARNAATPTRQKSSAFDTDADSNVDGGDVRNCSKVGETMEKRGKKRPPPLVVFGYGGGWRRGDKQTWRHYISRWDVNLALAALVGRDRYYSNIGESFVSRGIPCAVLSYPLVPTPFPINLFEIGSSFVLSFAVILLLALSSTLILDVVLISLSYSSLMLRTWDYLQNHLDYPILTVLAVVAILSQLLTLGIMVSRELSLKSQNQSKSGMSLSNFISILIVFSAIIWAVLTLDSYCSYIPNNIRMLSVSGALVLFVQYLVYHFQKMTTFRQTSSRSCLVADPKGQAKCVALAMRWLVDYGRSTGHFDPESLVLMGHSAGGHLLSLVALDHHYLTDVGIDHRIIKGVITLSAVHDLRSISAGLPYHIYLKPAFGKDPSYWTSMSPIEYIKLDEKVVKTVDKSDSRQPLPSTPTSPSLGNNPTPTNFRSPLSSTINSFTPHRPHFLIISAGKDFDFMIKDSEMMHSSLEINGYQSQRHFIQGCNHFTMVRKFGCPWYQYWIGHIIGIRRDWKPTDGELMCWDFVQQFWNCE